MQILLPLYDNDGGRQPDELFRRVRTELTEKFGGLTAYSRAPATGLWQDGGEMSRDEIVVHEVMTGDLDAAWWAGYRKRLEDDFRQEEIVVRAQAITKL